MNLLRKILNRPTLAFRRHQWRIHFKRWRNLDDTPIDRPIFLLGVQGGGLTLLARMLRRHTRVVSVTGNHAYWAGPDEMQNVMGSALPAALTGLHHKIPHAPSFPFRDGVYAIDELLPLYRETAASASSQKRQQLIKFMRLALAMHAPQPATARFLDKSQTFTVRLSLLNALLSHCHPHFILVTRNPYASCYRDATRLKSLRALTISLRERLQLTAQHWSNSYYCALDDAHQIVNFHVLSFENLLRSPREYLQQVCHFVNLPFQESMLPAPEDTFPLGATGSAKGDHKWYPLRTDVNQKYLNRLEPWMVEVLQSYVGSLAEKWHYTPEGP